VQITKKSTITRRKFIRTIGKSAAAIGLSSPAISSVSKGLNASSRPNLLIIQTDQQSRWAVSAYPRLPGDQVVVITPHSDSIGQNGARLDNFFVNIAVCTPSRASLLTGRYAEFTGAYSNDKPLKDNEITIAEALKDQGYVTGYCGKWHLSGGKYLSWGNPDWTPGFKTHGFDDADYLLECGHFKKIVEDPTGRRAPQTSNEIGDEKTYPTDFFTMKAVEFIRKSRTQPFCFMVSILDPHDTYPREIDSLYYETREPYASQYKPGDMIVPPTIGRRNKNLNRERRAIYCGMVKLIDDSVGKIINALKETGQYDNTIIIFTSDHGDYMGEHGLYFKQKMYETVYRVPFLIQWPARISPGQVITNLISNIDVHPTLMALMGFTPNARIHGEDFSHLLLNQRGNWTDEVYQNNASQDHAGISTPKWHLCVSQDGHTDDGVPGAGLFDRINDPWEQTNLFDDPNYRQIRDLLISRVVLHHVEFNTIEKAWLQSQYGGGLLGVQYVFSEQGWYMVSIPVVPQDNSVADLFPTALNSTAYSWNPATKSYDEFSYIEPGKGYWLAVTGPTTANIFGIPLNKFSVHFTSAGWYMTGSVRNTSDFADPDDDPDGMVLTPAYTWNTNFGKYVTASSLKEKNSYWVAVLGECNLTIENTVNSTRSASLAKNDPQRFYDEYGAEPPTPPDMDWKQGRFRETPREHALKQNFPNPFNHNTVIEYWLPERSHTEIHVYDLKGQSIRTLVNSSRSAGRHRIEWDGRNNAGQLVSSGQYLIRIVADDFEYVRKATLLK
jgi:arylsulfatase A-like enzyme